MIERIDDLARFDELRASWDEVYAADSHTQIFLSWTWMRGWLAVTPHDWLILAVREEGAGAYVAFLPLATEVIQTLGFDVVRNLHMGGQPFAPYTGFLCRPEVEAAAFFALAAHVERRLDWETFQFREVMDPRLDAFLGHFASGRFARHPIREIPCPYVRLPGDWEQYLEESLGARTRRDLRRSFRKVEDSTNLRVTHATAADLDQHLEVLLQSWTERWGASPPYFFEAYRSIYPRCAAEDRLWLAVMWDDDVPVAVLSGFVDRVKRTFTACTTASNRGYSQLRPGKTLYGYSIRYAIEQGCSLYDFTLGDEDYKMSFGASLRYSMDVHLTRESARARGARALSGLGERVRRWRREPGR